MDFVYANKALIDEKYKNNDKLVLSDEQRDNITWV
jgi:hypothetical protein